MAKIDALRRFFFPCLFPPSATPTTSSAATATSKKRISTSLRDDLYENSLAQDSQKTDQDSSQRSPSSPNLSSSSLSAAFPSVVAPPRPSKSMVIGTIFGNRRGHVSFCVQHDRLTTNPFLLLELSILTQQLVNEMRSGFVRIALECNHTELELYPLRSVPIWTTFCNGRKFGFATRKKASEQVRLMLKAMQSTTVGAGVIPPAIGADSEEVTYMRANYEHVVGSADSEAFHLINPDDCPSQELSFFLLRSRNGKSR